VVAVERDGLGDDHDRGGIALGACLSSTDNDQNGVGGHLLRGALRG